MAAGRWPRMRADGARSVPPALAALGLVLLAVLAHAPSLNGGFIVDDLHYVADNVLLDDLEGLRTIWTDPHRLLVYYPLTFTTFWVENQLCGRDPRCFHATNLLLHALTALLAWRVLSRLAVPGAWLAAALFAVHPLHVDTVAWVAERKNVLSGALALGALLAWLAFERRSEGGERRAGLAWAAGLTLFLAALLAKTPILGLPLVAVLATAWRRGSFARRDLAAVPWLVAGLALAAITVVVERGVVEVGDEMPVPSLVERPLLAARATWFYLGKLLWPAGLAFDYGHWSTDPGEPANLAAALALAGLLGALWAGRRRFGLGPALAVASFLVLAAPALGLVSFYFHRYSFVAGHFVYLASLPVLALVAAGASRAATTRLPHALGVALAAAAIGVLATLTWRHAPDYRDHETLARATLEVNPDSWLAHNHLGNEALRRRDFAAAIAHLSRAERAAPGRIETQLDLALAQMNLGDLAAAEASARRALAIRDAPLARRLLGDVHLRAGRFDDAASEYRGALARDPETPRARAGLGIALARAGRASEAVPVLEAAVRAEPSNVAARTALAFALDSTGRKSEAIAEIDRALALAPGDPALLRNRELLAAPPPR
jgi:Flp pilus assembly protein TadD